jgi:hypothetical protein
MTTTPYSDAWRERTTERMAELRLTDGEVERRCGIDPGEHIDDDGAISLEITGPIDELLAKLEDAAEAKALDDGPAEAVVQHRNGRWTVRPGTEP